MTRAEWWVSTEEGSCGCSSRELFVQGVSQVKDANICDMHRLEFASILEARLTMQGLQGTLPFDTSRADPQEDR